MSRKLKDIETTEVSFVDKPATEKKFLFFKARGEGRGVGGATQADGGAKYCVCPECGHSEKHEKTGEAKSTPCTKINCPKCGAAMQGSDTKVSKEEKIKINIESDGTIDGTKITLNGDEVKELKDFSFHFYSGEGDVYPTKPVSCSYSKIVKEEDGFHHSETFYLTKGDTSMNPEILKMLQEYLGDEKIDIEKAEELSDKAVDAIKEALKLVNKYKGDFPDDLTKAVGTLAKYAGYGYGYPAKKEKEDVSKSGAKFSKDTLDKLAKAVEALEALKSVLPKLKEETQKSDVEKTVEKLNKSIEELEKKNKAEADEGLAKTLKELTNRLETVEKGTGIKKSVTSQDGNNGADADKRWPSFST